MGHISSVFRASAWILIFLFGFEPIAQGASELSLRPTSIPLSLALSMPASVARVGERYDVPFSKKIYLIEDAHTNPSGQLNLAKALERIFATESSLSTVFVEAGSGDNSFTALRVYGDKKLRQRIAMPFIRSGQLHGEEYLNLVSDKTFTIWGVEDLPSYGRSIASYRRVAGARSNLEPYLASIQSALDSLKTRIAGQELLSILESREAYYSGRKSVTDYFEALSNAALYAGMETGDYPALQKLNQVRVLEQQIDFTKAQSEQAEAVAALPRQEREALEASKTDQNKTSKFKHDDRAQDGYFAALEEKLGKAAGYPELFKYFDYRRKAQSVEADRLWQESEELEAAIISRLARTADERALVRVVQAHEFWAKLFKLALTPAEFDKRRQYLDPASIRQVTGFLNGQILKRETLYERALFLEPEFQEALNAAKEFYDLTRIRDEHFISGALKKMDESGEDRAVLISGGFHSPNLKRLLRDKRISYVCITPQVLSETNHKRYEEILLKQPSSFGPKEVSQSTVSTNRTMANVLAYELAGARMSETVYGRLKSELRSASGARLASPSANRELQEARSWSFFKSWLISAIVVLFTVWRVGKDRLHRAYFLSKGSMFGDFDHNYLNDLLMPIASSVGVYFFVMTSIHLYKAAVKYLSRSDKKISSDRLLIEKIQVGLTGFLVLAEGYADIGKFFGWLPSGHALLPGETGDPADVLMYGLGAVIGLRISERLAFYGSRRSSEATALSSYLDRLAGRPMNFSSGARLARTDKVQFERWVPPQWRLAIQAAADEYAGEELSSSDAIESAKVSYVSGMDPWRIELLRDPEKREQYFRYHDRTGTKFIYPVPDGTLVQKAGSMLQTLHQLLHPMHPELREAWTSARAQDLKTKKRGEYRARVAAFRRLAAIYHDTMKIPHIRDRILSAPEQVYSIIVTPVRGSPYSFQVRVNSDRSVQLSQPDGTWKTVQRSSVDRPIDKEIRQVRHILDSERITIEKYRGFIADIQAVIEDISAIQNRPAHQLSIQKIKKFLSGEALDLEEMAQMLDRAVLEQRLEVRDVLEQASSELERGKVGVQTALALLDEAAAAFSGEIRRMGAIILFFENKRVKLEQRRARLDAVLGARLAKKIQSHAEELDIFSLPPTYFLDLMDAEDAARREAKQGQKVKGIKQVLPLPAILNLEDVRSDLEKIISLSDYRVTHPILKKLDTAGRFEKDRFDFDYSTRVKQNRATILSSLEGVSEKDSYALEKLKQAWKALEPEWTPEPQGLLGLIYAAYFNQASESDLRGVVTPAARGRLMRMKNRKSFVSAEQIKYRLGYGQMGYKTEDRFFPIKIFLKKVYKDLWNKPLVIGDQSRSAIVPDESGIGSSEPEPVKPSVRPLDDGVMPASVLYRGHSYEYRHGTLKEIMSDLAITRPEIAAQILHQGKLKKTIHLFDSARRINAGAVPRNSWQDYRVSPGSRITILNYGARLALKTGTPVIDTKAVLLPVDISPKEDFIELSLAGETYRFNRKREFHVTLPDTVLHLQKGLSSAGLPAERSDVEKLIQKALEGLEFTIHLYPSRYEMLEEPEGEGYKRTLILIIEKVEGLEEFYNRLRKSVEAAGLMGFDPNKSARDIPLHITIYTQGTAKGIGLHTKAEYEELRVELTDEQQAMLGRALGIEPASEMILPRVTYELLRKGVTSPVFFLENEAHVTLVVRGHARRIGLEIASDGSMQDIIATDEGEYGAADGFYLPVVGAEAIRRSREIEAFDTRLKREILEEIVYRRGNTYHISSISRLLGLDPVQAKKSGSASIIPVRASARTEVPGRLKNVPVKPLLPARKPLQNKIVTAKVPVRVVPVVPVKPAAVAPVRRRVFSREQVEIASKLFEGHFDTQTVGVLLGNGIDSAERLLGLSFEEAYRLPKIGLTRLVDIANFRDFKNASLWVLPEISGAPVRDRLEADFWEVMIRRDKRLSVPGADRYPQVVGEVIDYMTLNAYPRILIQPGFIESVLKAQYDEMWSSANPYGRDYRTQLALHGVVNPVTAQRAGRVLGAAVDYWKEQAAHEPVTAGLPVAEPSKPAALEISPWVRVQARVADALRLFPFYNRFQRIESRLDLKHGTYLLSIYTGSKSDKGLYVTATLSREFDGTFRLSESLWVSDSFSPHGLIVRLENAVRRMDDEGRQPNESNWPDLIHAAFSGGRLAANRGVNRVLPYILQLGDQSVEIDGRFSSREEEIVRSALLKLGEAGVQASALATFSKKHVRFGTGQIQFFDKQEDAPSGIENRGWLWWTTLGIVSLVFVGILVSLLDQMDKTENLAGIFRKMPFYLLALGLDGVVYYKLYPYFEPLPVAEETVFELAKRHRVITPDQYTKLMKETGVLSGGARLADHGSSISQKWQEGIQDLSLAKKRFIQGLFAVQLATLGGFLIYGLPAFYLAVTGHLADALSWMPTARTFAAMAFAASLAGILSLIARQRMPVYGWPRFALSLISSAILLLFAEWRNEMKFYAQATHHFMGPKTWATALLNDLDLTALRDFLYYVEVGQMNDGLMNIAFACLLYLFFVGAYSFGYFNRETGSITDPGKKPLTEFAWANQQRLMRTVVFVGTFLMFFSGVGEEAGYFKSKFLSDAWDFVALFSTASLAYWYTRSVSSPVFSKPDYVSTALEKGEHTDEHSWAKFWVDVVSSAVITGAYTFIVHSSKYLLPAELSDAPDFTAFQLRLRPFELLLLSLVARWNMNQFDRPDEVTQLGHSYSQPAMALQMLQTVLIGAGMAALYLVWAAFISQLAYWGEFELVWKAFMYATAAGVAFSGIAKFLGRKGLMSLSLSAPEPAAHEEPASLAVADLSKEAETAELPGADLSDAVILTGVPVDQLEEKLALLGRVRQLKATAVRHETKGVVGTLFSLNPRDPEAPYIASIYRYLLDSEQLYEIRLVQGKVTLYESGKKGARLSNELVSVVESLRAKGIFPALNGVPLASLQTENLMDHIERYSVLRDPEDVLRILSARLRSDEQNPSDKPLLQIYDAAFDQKNFIQNNFSLERPMKIAVIRGGSGVSDLIRNLKELGAVVTIQNVLGATDDGRSWFYAARDFGATGIPDAGKALLDLATDKGIEDFLKIRLTGSAEELSRDFSNFLRKWDEPALVLPESVRGLFEKSRQLDPEKWSSLRGYLLVFEKVFHEKYPKSRFSLHQVPLRSVVLLGAAWSYGEDPSRWQRAVDEVGEILGVAKGDRVVLLTQERPHLVAMTTDGTIYFTETGINELPKRAPYLGLWLTKEPIDPDVFKEELARMGIHLRMGVVDEDDIAQRPEILSDLGMRQEIEQSTRKVSPNHAQAAAKLISSLSSTGKYSTDKTRVTLEGEQALGQADAVIYGTTTMESNMGSAVLVPGVNEAIQRNLGAVKILLANPVRETDAPRTKAFHLFSRLTRYLSGRVAYIKPNLDFTGIENSIEYVLGIDPVYPKLDSQKEYIPFDGNTISAVTDGAVSAIGLDLEMKRPTRLTSKLYGQSRAGFGLYDPRVESEAIIALTGIKMAGYRISSAGVLEPLSTAANAAGARLVNNWKWHAYHGWVAPLVLESQPSPNRLVKGASLFRLESGQVVSIKEDSVIEKGPRVVRLARDAKQVLPGFSFKGVKHFQGRRELSGHISLAELAERAKLSRKRVLRAERAGILAPPDVEVIRDGDSRRWRLYHAKRSRAVRDRLLIPRGMWSLSRSASFLGVDVETLRKAVSLGRLLPDWSLDRLGKNQVAFKPATIMAQIGIITPFKREGRISLTQLAIKTKRERTTLLKAVNREELVPTETVERPDGRKSYYFDEDSAARRVEELFPSKDLYWEGPELAIVLGVSLQTVLRAKGDGRIPSQAVLSVKRGNRTYYYFRKSFKELILSNFGRKPSAEQTAGARQAVQWSTVRPIQMDEKSTPERAEIAFRFEVSPEDREPDLLVIADQIFAGLEKNKQVLNDRLKPFSFRLESKAIGTGRLNFNLRSDRNGEFSALGDPLNNALDGLKARAKRDGRAYASEIKIAVTDRAGQMEFSIEDNGTGVSTDILRSLFNGYQSWKNEVPGEYIGRSGEGVRSYGYMIFKGTSGYLKIETRALDEPQSMSLTIDFQKIFESARDVLVVTEGTRQGTGTSVVWVFPKVGARLAIGPVTTHEADVVRENFMRIINGPYQFAMDASDEPQRYLFTGKGRTKIHLHAQSLNDWFDHVGILADVEVDGPGFIQSLEIERGDFPEASGVVALADLGLDPQMPVLVEFVRRLREEIRSKEDILQSAQRGESGGVLGYTLNPGESLTRMEELFMDGRHQDYSDGLVFYFSSTPFNLDEKRQEYLDNSSRTAGARLVEKTSAPAHPPFYLYTEGWVSRDFDHLDKKYMLTPQFQRRAPENVLLIGVGRGVAAVEMALRYPTAHITAVNKESDLWKEGVQNRKMRAKGYGDVQINAARTRISLKVFDVEDENQIAQALGDEVYDTVIFEDMVQVYFHDKVKVLERFFNERLKPKGLYAFMTDYSEIQSQSQDDRSVEKADRAIISAFHPGSEKILGTGIDSDAYILIKKSTEPVRIPLEWLRAEKPSEDRDILRSVYRRVSDPGAGPNLRGGARQAMLEPFFREISGIFGARLAHGAEIAVEMPETRIFQLRKTGQTLAVSERSGSIPLFTINLSKKDRSSAPSSERADQRLATQEQGARLSRHIRDSRLRAADVWKSAVPKDILVDISRLFGGLTDEAFYEQFVLFADLWKLLHRNSSRDTQVILFGMDQLSPAQQNRVSEVIAQTDGLMADGRSAKPKPGRLQAWVGFDAVNRRHADGALYFDAEAATAQQAPDWVSIYMAVQITAFDLKTQSLVDDRTGKVKWTDRSRAIAALRDERLAALFRSYDPGIFLDHVSGARFSKLFIFALSDLLWREAASIKMLRRLLQQAA